MPAPLVSVVIPTLNEGDHIERCLNSLADQSFRDFEVLVVDNGSTDGTVRRARAHRCRVLHESRRGVSAARQTGFAAARGRIVASTDADTVLPRDWLARIVASYRESPQLIGIYGPVRLQGDDRQARYRWVEDAFDGFLRFNQGLRRPHFCGANFAVRRDAFERVGGFRSRKNGVYYRTAEDVQLSLKLRRLGKVRYLKDLTVHTSPRNLNSFKYLWSNTKTYWAVAWLGEER